MSGARGPDRARRYRRTAGLAVVIAGAGALAVRLLGSPAHADSGKGLLVICALAAGVWLLWSAQRGLRLQRPPPLRPACRSPDRVASVSADLYRIISEVRKARKSRAQFAKGLGARLRDIAVRRGAAVVPDPAREGSEGRGRERGLSAEEIGERIARIEGS